MTTQKVVSTCPDYHDMIIGALKDGCFDCFQKLSAGKKEMATELWGAAISLIYCDGLTSNSSNYMRCILYIRDNGLVWEEALCTELGKNCEIFMIDRVETRKLESESWNGYRIKYGYTLDSARSSRAMVCRTCKYRVEKRKLEIKNALEDNLNGTDCELPVFLFQLISIFIFADN